MSNINMNLVNNLIKAVEDLQAAGIGVEIEQEEDGKFAVGTSLDIPDICINASFPKEQEEAA